MNKTKLEVIKLINNDVITTSECELLNIQHFKIEGEQELLPDGFSGRYYSFNKTTDAIPVYYSTQFKDQSGTLGWYHLDSNTGAFVWCENQEHNDFLENYQTVD